MRAYWGALGRATRPEWIYSEGFYFEPRAAGEGFSGFVTTKKQKKDRPKTLVAMMLPH